MTSQPAPWWRTAVFYEVYLRSFADGDGDGVGDLAGLRDRLPYLADLGVDALWITPFYPSPMVDHGYDVTDPRGVDPLFGDLPAFDAMLADAHALGIRVTVDVVPNHTSDQHPWFRAALAAPAGSPERDRYLFRDGRGPAGAEPPNNWQSAFGGPAWERVPDGQWYLHHFAPGQPDLNWRHPEVRADAERTLRFWLDRGVDGFRVDVAHGLVKDARLRDNPGVHRWGIGHGPETRYAWDQPETHEVYRSWRRLLDSYPGDRMAVGEVYLADAAARARYVRPDELHLAFNFALLWAGWDATELREAIDGSLTVSATVGAATTWVLSSHDAVRHRTRYGGGELGRRRARAAALLLLGLPGPAYLYQGEELGLPEVDLPDEVLQDPVFTCTGGERRGRDGCRVPLPWSGHRPPYGFGAGRGRASQAAADADGDSVAARLRRGRPGAEAEDATICGHVGDDDNAAGRPARTVTGRVSFRQRVGSHAPETWLPQPADWGPLTVEAQRADPASMLALYRAALATRRAEPALRGGTLSWLESPSGVLAFARTPRAGGPAVVVAVNLSGRAVPTPPGRPLLVSDPAAPAGTLPPDAAVWVRPPR